MFPMPAHSSKTALAPTEFQNGATIPTAEIWPRLLAARGWDRICWNSIPAQEIAVTRETRLPVRYAHKDISAIGGTMNKE